MGFFKNLFSGRESFVPTPTQEVSGIQPIVVQAIENLFPNADDQKYAFNQVLKWKEIAKIYHEPKRLLALLAYSKGKREDLLDPDSPLLRDGRFMIEEISPIFPKMQDAEAWVQSITKSQA